MPTDLTPHTCTGSFDETTGAIRWKCSTCAYEMVISLDGMRVIHPGDPDACHSGSLGLAPGVEMRVGHDVPEEFSEWIEGHDGILSVL